MTGSRPLTLTPGHPLLGLGYSQPVETRRFVHLSEDGASPGEAPVAEEVPVAFVYNERPHAVMMATPADFEDFAIGFTLTEQIVGAPGEITRADVVRHSQGVELHLTIPRAASDKLAERARQVVGRTGCGLCGVETIDDALRPPRVVSATWRITPEILWRAEAALDAFQQYNRATGAVHAAAWASPQGELRVVREDVGRHNALDKVLGALARLGLSPEDGFLVMTSRASYELVQKAAIASVPLLAAISRPTGLAIRLAEASGLTLVGLLRGKSANVYAHGYRLGVADPQP